MTKNRRDVLELLNRGEFVANHRSPAAQIAEILSARVDSTRSIIADLARIGWVEVERGAVGRAGVPSWVAVRLGPDAPPLAPPAVAVAAEPREDATAEPASGDSLLALDAGEVAAELLRRCLEVITQPERLEEMAIRLAQQVEYGQVIRRKVALLADELAAVKAERDGLRHRLHAVEANLEAVKRDRGSFVDVEVRRQLDRVMRERPRVAG